MRLSLLTVAAMSVVVLVAPAGCGGSQSQLGPAGAIAPNNAVRTGQGRSWMDARAKPDNLLYVSNTPAGSPATVTVYSWRLTKLVGTLTGFTFPEGLCVDKAQNVWVADWGAADLVEYAHGGTTPIKRLSFPYGNPISCSVDRTTGNLAVTNNSVDPGVYVYANASGTPTHYTDRNILTYVDLAYDDLGNLFVDGDGAGLSLPFVLTELPGGGTTLESIALNKPITIAGALQWDGKYLAICDTGPSPNVLYQFSIAGSSGTLAGTTVLDGASLILQFWVPKFGNGKVNPQGTRVVGADFDNNDVAYWIYPTGGAAFKTITNGIGRPEGVTVSKGRKM